MTVGLSLGVICVAALPASVGQGQLLLLSLHHSSSSLDLPYFRSWSLQQWEANFFADRLHTIPWAYTWSGNVGVGLDGVQSSGDSTSGGARGVHGMR